MQYCKHTTKNEYLEEVSDDTKILWKICVYDHIKIYAVT